VPRHFKGIFRTAQSRLRSKGPNIEAYSGRERVGSWGGAVNPSPSARGLGSAVISTSWVWGGAPAEIHFDAF